MLWVLLVLNGFYSMINDPFIPFILWFDNFNNYPGLFKYSLRSGFVIFGIYLFIIILLKMESYMKILSRNIQKKSLEIKPRM
jgi:hypothetical protein